MNTTLVNTGILNGRSSTLDATDLVTLGELVKNCSTNVVASTPEILIGSVDVVEDSYSSHEQFVSIATPTGPTEPIAPPESETSVRGSNTAESNPIAPKTTAERSADSERIAQQIRLLLEEDGSTSYADQAHQRIPTPKTRFEAEISDVQSAADQAAKDEVNSVLRSFESNESDFVDPVTEEPVVEAPVIDAPPAEAPVEHRVDEPENKTPQTLFPPSENDLTLEQQIEVAKQRAIEATNVAAGKRDLKSEVQDPEVQSSNVPSEELQGAHTDDLQAASLDFEASQARIDELIDAAKSNAIQRTEENLETLARNNLVVEEISAALAKKLEADISGESDAAEIHTFGQPTHKTLPIKVHTEKQHVRLADNILDRAVPGIPSAILLTSCDSDESSGQVATNLAAILASRGIGNVLLIDADVDSKQLTDDLTNMHVPGLIEILNQHVTVGEAVMSTALHNLQFLPVGNAALSRQNTLNARMAKLNEELKQNYRFIIISGSNAQDQFTQTWGTLCESTYLLVSLGETLNTVASNAATQLQSTGSRLLGCIVTNRA